MQKKILSFMYADRKFLVLRSEPHPEHGPGGWFVVTGSVEKDESPTDAVKREIKEETNLEVTETIALNWGSRYKWRGEECEELNFLSFVKPGNVVLNEEHAEYAWLGLDDFVSRIKWDSDKDILKKVLEKAIKRKLHFKVLKVEEY